MSASAGQEKAEAVRDVDYAAVHERSRKGKQLMKRVLCTMPGMTGDVIWALPTIRAIAEANGAPVSFMTSATYARVVPLVAAQEYVEHAWFHPGWALKATAPLTPWDPPTDVVGGDFARFHGGYDVVCHLGYRAWPEMQLAHEIARIGRVEYPWAPLSLDLGRPWLRVPKSEHPRGYQVVFGFTDEWAELKAGLLVAAHGQLFKELNDDMVAVPPPGSRLEAEWLRPMASLDWDACDLLIAAEYISRCGLFVGDLSALAVIAAGLGKPRVLIEPDPARHHANFQHWDTALVMGNDGRPTFDSRALVAAVRKKLEELDAPAK